MSKTIDPGKTYDYTSPECNRRSGKERRVNYARLVKVGTRFYRHNEAMAEVNQRKLTKERRKV